MKLIAIVINNDLIVEGIVCKGQLNEFGKAGTDVTSMYMPIDRAESIVNKNDTNFKIRNGRLIPDTGLYLYDVEIYINNGNKKIRIDNRMEITKQIIVDGEVEGYVVKFIGAGNQEMKLKKEAIYKLDYFKPINFFTRYKNDEIEVVSKPDCVPLTKLPSIVVNTRKEVVKEPESSVIPEKKVSNTAESSINAADVDIKTIFNKLYEEGVGILITDTSFYDENESKFNSDNAFKAENIRNKYVTASAELEYCEPFVKACLNATIHGNVDIKDAVVPVKVKVKKTVIENTEVKMNEFGIIIPNTKLSNITPFLKAISNGDNRKVTISKYDNLNELSRIKNTVDLTSNTVLKVKLNNIDIMSKSAIDESLMTIEDIVDNQALLIMHNVYLKLVKSLTERARSEFNMTQEIYDDYKKYESKTIGRMKLKSIDVYTGNYNRRFNVSDEYVDNAYKYEYCILGMNYISKITKEKLINGDISDISAIANGACYKQILRIREEVSKISGYEEKQAYLEKRRNTINDSIAYLKEILWCNKIAQMITSGNNRVHESDKAMWKYVAGGKIENNYVYKEEVKSTKCFETCKVGVKLSGALSIAVM